MIRSASFDGFTLECGPNVLVERPDLMRIVGEVGIADRLVYPSVNPYGQYVWHRGAAEKVPATFLEFLRTPLLPLARKLALPYKLVKPGVLTPNEDDETVELFFSRLIGKYATRALLDPVLKGIYGGDVDRLSARSIFYGLWDAARQGKSVLRYKRERTKGGKPSILVLRGGIELLVQTLWERIAPHIDFIPEAAVDITKLVGSGYRVVTNSGRVIDAESCVLTTAGGNLAGLMQQALPGISERLANIRYASLTVVHLSVPRDQRLIKDAFGVLCPSGMRSNFLGVMFNSQIFPSMAPADKHLLTVILGGAQAGDEAPNIDGIKRDMPNSLLEMFSISGAQVIGSTHWARAIPQLEVGHHRIVEALDELERSWPGIVVAGVDRGGIGVSDRIRVASEAVSRLGERKALKEAV
jgi:oxygen-dependent protoporphyrinogen oxidase